MISICSHLLIMSNSRTMQHLLKILSIQSQKRSIPLMPTSLWYIRNCIEKNSTLTVTIAIGCQIGLKTLHLTERKVS